MRYHKLTEQIYKGDNWDKSDVDSTVRKWLSEAAEKILEHKNQCSNPVALNGVMKILGLEPKGEEVNLHGKHCPNYCSCKNPKWGQRWCSHISWALCGGKRGYCLSKDGGLDTERHFDAEEWDMCPVKGCHAPRPSKPTKREELAEKLFRYWNPKYAWETTHEETKKDWREAADIALSFLGGKGE